MNYPYLVLFGALFSTFLTLAVIAYAIYLDLRGRKLREIEEDDPTKIIDGVTGVIVKRRLLNDGEYSFYKLMLGRLDQRYMILPYVRIRDVVFIDTKRRPKAFFLEAIARMHFDFLICDRVNVQPVAAIEYDGQMHGKPHVQEWDAIKNKACAEAGIHLVRVKAKMGFTLSEIDAVLEDALGK